MGSSNNLSIVSDECHWSVCCLYRKAMAIWKSILNSDVTDETDFFAAGAGSMDVVRSGDFTFHRHGIHTLCICTS